MISIFSATSGVFVALLPKPCGLMTLPQGVNMHAQKLTRDNRAPSPGGEHGNDLPEPQIIFEFIFRLPEGWQVEIVPLAKNPDTKAIIQ